MLCEQCQAREATVHQTFVLWPSDGSHKHFCAPCYAQADHEKHEAWNLPPIAPAIPMPDVEHITASEFLQAQEQARDAGADTPPLKQILTEFARFPHTRSRLAFEFLQLAWENLENGSNPALLTAMSGNFWELPESERPPRYAELVEKIMRRIFARLASPAEESRQRLFWSLVFASLILKKVDHERHAALIQEFKAECEKSALPSVRALIVEVEERIGLMAKNQG